MSEVVRWPDYSRLEFPRLKHLTCQNPLFIIINILNSFQSSKNVEFMGRHVNYKRVQIAFLLCATDTVASAKFVFPEPSTTLYLTV